MGSKNYKSILIVILSLLMHLNFNIANAITLDDVHIDYINPDYVNMDTFNFTMSSQNNVVTINERLDVIKDIPSDAYIKVTATTRAFGHDIPSGLGFKSDICSNQGKAFFDKVVKPLGVNDCPPKKGLYEINDFAYDFSTFNFPSVVKSGSIQFLIELFAEGDTKIGQMTASFSA